VTTSEPLGHEETAMAHAHTCHDCGAVLEVGDFDCEVEDDHRYGLCERCAGTEDAPDETIDIGGGG
jgi:hypothetical protein